MFIILKKALNKRKNYKIYVNFDKCILYVYNDIMSIATKQCVTCVHAFYIFFLIVLNFD